VGWAMSEDIKAVSGRLERYKTGAPAIKQAGVVAGANEAARAGLRAYTGSESLTVVVPGAFRQAPRIKAAIEAGMEAEFKRQSA